jgi:cytochrome P450
MNTANTSFNSALRLYPVFPIMRRIASNDTILPLGGGKNDDTPIFIARGTRLLSNFYRLHRNEVVFGPDVQQFIPDRLDSINPGAWEFMPFSGGPHACVGQHKASVEASYMVFLIARTFKTLEKRDSVIGRVR